ncbi:MAG: FAD-binding oxidoreductase [Solirubrobacteraceae bacterium]
MTEQHVVRGGDVTVTEFNQLLPASQVITDRGQLAGYAHDAAHRAPYELPLAVLKPRDTADVVTIVRHCAERSIPLVARGSGTGLVGGANAISDCVVVSFEAMDAVLHLDADERLAIVQPGVINEQLRQACAARGVWYPPDPASARRSTVGGNVATNAGGICCVKYGVTGSYVLGVEAVVGHGEVVRLGRRTMKGVAGYDLTGLMVGSEGTLGLITEITLRLRGPRGAERTVIGYFDDLRSAGRAAASVMASGVVPSALELVDRFCLQAVDQWRHLGLNDRGAVLLLARCDEPGPTGEQEADTILACFDEAGAVHTANSRDEAEGEELFAARRLVFPALERLGTVLSEDVCVPRMCLVEMLERVARAAEEHDVYIATLAHAGDGNLHPMVVVPHGDEDAATRGRRAFARIINEALALGGTVTGEHGIGLLKLESLTKEVTPAVLALYRGTKETFDPAGIFNPGKVFA